ncbi:MAG: sigma-70 family RNA polymerase sigma factor [Fimbriimonadales bacterium]|nr:sigma-70 family RNA polymerase sigma factor [Fimbriimonadales bacterium]
MLSDEWLVARCLEGDLSAFDRLVERYKDRVFSLAFRMLGDASWAEDLTQEAFLRAYTRLGLYNPSQPFATWLLCMTARLCLNALRDRRTEQERLERAAKAMPPAPTLEEQLYARERQRTLQRLLLRLPAEQRATLLLHYTEGLPLKEVAEQLGAPIGTIKTWLHRGREQLRRWIEEELG